MKRGVLYVLRVKWRTTWAWPVCSFSGLTSFFPGIGRVRSSLSLVSLLLITASLVLLEVSVHQRLVSV